MNRLPLSLAICRYDRTRAIVDGQVSVDGCDVVATALEPEEAFHRAFKYQEFDITELSLSSYTMMASRGDCPYIAIPAFVSRAFRHSGIYIRTDREITSPAELAGKTVGVPEYQITANVWIRGILEDEYGLKPSSIRWRQGGLEEPGRTERAPLRLPPDIDFALVPENRTLSEMFAKGELDAIIGARAPSCVLTGASNVARMFPDYRKAEKIYYQKTGIFPIMHVVGIRRSIIERHPWVAVNVYKAFLAAKWQCMTELAQVGHLYTSLPWAVAEFEDTRSLMGEDFWSYGLRNNTHVLNAFLRYHFHQGLSARRIDEAELFAASTVELSKI
jgi:4,5-dihydroxyphthalate decarboxylase